MKNWLKKQLTKRLWTVVTGFLFLSYLLSWGVFGLFFTDNMNEWPLICRLLVGAPCLWIWFAALPIMISSIVGICSKDKVGKIWCVAFLLLDLYPLYMSFPMWRRLFIGY